MNLTVCKGIDLDPLQEGSAVQGRYLHGEGGKQWVFATDSATEVETD